MKSFDLTLFFRKSNPSFFSIEKVFRNIGNSISINSNGNIRVTEVYMPYFSKLWNLLSNTLFARRNQKGVNHITGDIHYVILGLSNRTVNVLTIHDCVLLNRFSKYDVRFWIIKWLWYELPVRKADCVTVISEQTKIELLRFVPGVEHKIRVVPNFIDPAFKPVEKIFNTEKPVLLFVGTTPNKNLDRLAEAIAGMPVILWVVGPLSIIQLTKLRENKIDFTQFIGLSDKELRDVYAGSDIIVFPTLYEGFGLPILEAQAIGRPLLTSNRPPMNFVAGKGACLVDPERVSSIRSGIERIISDENFRNILVKGGFDNVADYSLENVSREYIRLYNDLLAAKNVFTN